MLTASSGPTSEATGLPEKNARKNGSAQESVKAYPLLGSGLNGFIRLLWDARDGLPGLNVSGLRGRV